MLTVSLVGMVGVRRTGRMYSNHIGAMLWGQVEKIARSEYLE